MDSTTMLESIEALELAPDSRSHRLWEMTWNRTHEAALHKKLLVGCGENTLVGHARDFAMLLEASEPFIQDDELIVGGGLVTPEDGSVFDLGHYDPHFPPNHGILLSMGLAGIRDDAQSRAAEEADPDEHGFLEAVSIAYDAADGTWAGSVKPEDLGSIIEEVQ
jgi:hypothetical protein